MDSHNSQNTHRCEGVTNNSNYLVTGRTQREFHLNHRGEKTHFFSAPPTSSFSHASVASSSPSCAATWSQRSLNHGAAHVVVTVTYGLVFSHVFGDPQQRYSSLCVQRRACNTFAGMDTTSPEDEPDVWNFSLSAYEKSKRKLAADLSRKAREAQQALEQQAASAIASWPWDKAQQVLYNTPAPIEPTATGGAATTPATTTEPAAAVEAADMPPSNNADASVLPPLSPPSDERMDTSTSQK